MQAAPESGQGCRSTGQHQPQRSIPSVRAAAVHSISLQNDPALKKELEPLLQDDNEAVRLRAAAGYLRLSAIAASARAKK
jgi:HEAT repeat protein